MQGFKFGDWKRRKVVNEIRIVLRLDHLVFELRAASAFDGENRLGEAIELTETFRNQLISRLTPAFLKDVVKAIAQRVSTSKSVTYDKVLQGFADDFHDDRQLLHWCQQWTQIDDAQPHGDSIDLRLKSIIERSLLGLRWARQCESGLRAALRGAAMAPLLRELEVANGAAMLCLSQLNGFLPRYLFGPTRRWLRDHHEPMMTLLQANQSTLRHILAEAPETAFATRLTAIERCLFSLDDSSQSNGEPIAASVDDYFVSLYESTDSQLRDAMDGLEPQFCHELSGAAAEDIEVVEERDLRLRCILLVIRAWDRVAQSHQIPRIIWTLTDAWANRLASTADDKITIISANHLQQTDGKANMDSVAPELYEVEQTEPEKPAEMLAAGLVATSAAGLRRVIAPAKFSRPREVPRLYWRLHQVEKLTNPGLRVLCSICHDLKSLIGQPPSAATLKRWFEVADETSVAICKGEIETLVHELVLATTLPGCGWSDSESAALSTLQDAFIAEGIQFRSATGEELRHAASVRLCRGIPTPGRKSVVISWFADGPTKPHLLVSAGDSNTGPLAIWLADHWDRVESLRAKTPQWEHWPLVDQHRLAVFDHQGDEDKTAMTRRDAWQLFQLFCDHPPDLAAVHSSEFSAIAGDLYQIFELSGGQSLPRWDVSKQGYFPLKQEEVRTLPNFQWIKDSSPVGTVLSAVGWEQQIASHVGVSSGALPHGILDWIQLPCPGFAAKDTAIVQFWHRLVVMPFELQRNPDALKLAYMELRRQWSRSADDVAWLNSWVHHLMCEIPNDVEIRWYERLSKVITVLPCPDLHTKRLTWPATALTSGPLIHYKPNPQPIDTVVDQPPYDEVMFAVEVGQCAVCLSQSSELDAPIPKCNAALEVVRCELKGDENHALRTSLSILLVALRDYHRGIDWDVAWSKKISIGRAITDALNEALEYSRELPTTVTREGINRVIERLIAMGGDVGVKITPAGLDYANSSQWDESNAIPHPEFFDNREKGWVELNRFGVFAAGQTIQECEAVCSLGPIPPGQKILKQLAQITENSGVESTSQFLHKSLENLPHLVYQADRGDSHALLVELERLHQAYWSEIRPKGILPEDQLVKCDSSLRKLLAHYSLLTYPINETFMSDFRIDVERWFKYGTSVKLIDSTLRRGDRVQRGKIAKVVQPGLYYKGEDHPRVFATVELETVRTSAS